MSKARAVTMKQAFAKWKKIVGEKATASENPKAMTDDQKQEVREQLKLLHAELKAIRDAKQTRGNPRHTELEREIGNLSGALYGYRCTLGELGGFPGFPLNLVRGQGDTWEEALAKATAERKQNS